jgi:hypothetical protein
MNIRNKRYVKHAPSPVEIDLTFICDSHRHLVCLPYSIENLHKMAADLDINRCWFHKDHYDIPKKRVEEIEKKCKIVSTRDIVGIVRGIY